MMFRKSLFAIFLSMCSVVVWAVPGDEYWESMGGVNGVLYQLGSSAIWSTAVYDSNLYVAGQFNVIADIQANNIAKWDGSKWVALGDGISGIVSAIVVDNNGILYASANKAIHKWDGQSWQIIGLTSGTNSASALATDSAGNLYVGGFFSKIGVVTVNSLARWNGIEWSQVGGGVNNTVRKIKVDSQNRVFIQGDFTQANGQSMRYLGVWNGSNWQQIGVWSSGTLQNIILDLSENLVVCGTIDTYSGIVSNGVLKWNGVSWSGMGNGIGQGTCEFMLDASGSLYASVGGAIKKWNDPSWDPIDYGTGGAHKFYQMASDIYGNSYLVHSDVSQYQNQNIRLISKWDGASLTSLFDNKNLPTSLIDLKIDSKGVLYGLGVTYTKNGGAWNKIYKRLNDRWEDIGTIGCPTSTQCGAAAIEIDTNDMLYAVGTFSNVSGTAIGGVAVWNGLVWGQAGDDISGGVSSIAFDKDNRMYVAGPYINSAGGTPILNGVAKWDGASWSQVGSGNVHNSISKIVFDKNGNLIAGGSGNFNFGNSLNSSVAIWDGDQWHAVGLGVNWVVTKITVDINNNIYVSGWGGQETVGGMKVFGSVAKWDGKFWSRVEALDSGMANQTCAIGVDSLGNLYGKGSLVENGLTVEYNSLVVSDNNVLKMGGGLNKCADIIIESDIGNMYFAGSFNVAGGNAVGFVAKVSDADGDRINNFGDRFPLDGNEWLDSDNDGIGNNADTDDDNDAVYDINDNCQVIENYIQSNLDNDEYGDLCDLDDDNDFLSDDYEAEVSKTNPNNADTDGDSLTDGFEVNTVFSSGLYLSPLKYDTDGDTLSDGIEFNVYGTSPVNQDSDKDGLSDSIEINQTHTDPLNPDTDQDSYSDSVDKFPLDPTKWLDTDNDGIDDNSDNCPSVANTNQSDMDNDMIGDVCDPDMDGDGVSNASDDFPSNPLESKDTDGDGLGDNSDPDIDGDGVDNISDAFPFNQCARDDTDSDGMPNDIYCKSGDDFETGDLNQLPWQTSGPAWEISASHVYQGAYSAFTDASFWGQPSILSLTVATGSEISFQLDIDELNCSSSGIDFYIDGVLYANWNDWFCQGFDWTLFTVSLTPGVHEFSWIYTSWDDPGNSMAYLDNVSFGSDLVKDSDDDNDGVVDTADRYPLDNTRYQNPRHSTDIDRDSDLLTRSSSLGTWTRHSIQNAAITGTGSMNAYTSSSVQYVAQLDANADGDADILTRNTSTGAWYLHQVQTGAVTSTAPIYLYANLDQQFIGAGDFNNDGTDDVMLRSASAGYYTVFLLSNHAVSSTVFYNAWTSSQSVPQGVGDFDGDGTDDLLVRRTSDNLYFIFKTANGGTTNNYCACNVWRNPDWTFQFAGDTNKDGIDDIIIRATGATGDGFWWNFRMNNFISTQTTNLNTFVNKTQVSFAASGDYNADGHTDMLIRVNNGPVYVARIVNGLVSGSTTLLSNLPADQIVLK